MEQRGTEGEGQGTRRSGIGRLPWLALQGLADIIYPPVCVACGILVERHRGVCWQCWASLRLIERPFCEVLGLPFAHDHGAGAVSPQAIADPPPFDRLRSVAAHDGVARFLVHGLKYRDRTDLAPMMAAWMLRASDGHVAACDFVLPVPLHPFRLWGRRFNQAAELSRALARLSDKPHLADGLSRIRATRRQVGLGASQRAENLRGAFAVPDHSAANIAGRSLVLVDDVYTTGATVSAAAKALRKAGAREITVLTFATVLPDPI